MTNQSTHWATGTFYLTHHQPLQPATRNGAGRQGPIGHRRRVEHTSAQEAARAYGQTETTPFAQDHACWGSKVATS